MRQATATAKPAEIRLRPYVPEPTGRRFHASPAFVRGVMGPLGSGKSVMCCMEALSRALEAVPNNGVRKSRWCFVRNTYGELLSTTMKTWQDWVPPEICPISLSSPVQGIMNVPLADGTRLELEVLFLALDRDDDVKKLKSLELTGVWLNEASEIRESVLQMATGRVGRFPAEIDVARDAAGNPIRPWSGIVMDTNPPDDGHWWYRMAEEQKPEGYAFFKQPPALVPAAKKKPTDPTIWVPNDGSHGYEAAENVGHHTLGFDYWQRMVGGKDPEWLKVYVMGQYGAVLTGRVVYPEYNDSIHLAKEPITPMRGLPLLTAWDFGLNASCTFMQLTPKGQVLVLDELTSEEMGIQRFVREMVKPKIKERFPEMRLMGVGDPAGEARSQTTEQTCYQILAEEGIAAEAAPTNEFVARREAVVHFLTRINGTEPAFLLDPRCKVLRKGFMKHYQYRKMKLAGLDNRYTDRPDKNEYSHLHDALQYGCLFFKTYGSPGSPASMYTQRREVKPVNLTAWT